MSSWSRIPALAAGVAVLLLSAGYGFAQEPAPGGQGGPRPQVEQEATPRGQEGPPPQVEQEAAAAHEALFLEDRFPSATTCQTCHPDHYREWSVSAHAYAQMSPVFNSMQAAVFELTNGTNGDFCIRCHTPVGMNLEEPEILSNLDRHPTSREGITCVVCHRLTLPYGKVSGRLSIAEGDIFEPVYGPEGDARLRAAIESGAYGLNTDRERGGRNVHAEVVRFQQIDNPGFCATCHDVNLVNGFRLEEAFSEFKTSPAASDGTTCQDCHMGREPGVPSGYAAGPAARIGDRPSPDRKITNHMFAGPDYSILHPGVFPHNVEASRLATIAEWLTFDYQAGWGTDEFELNLPEGYEFPERWASIDDRYDARDVISDNQELLAEIAAQRLAVLRAGYQIGDVAVERVSDQGIELQVELHNSTEGHNVPTGFDAERIVWLQVQVLDGQGASVFESGDLDPNGDVRDSHSLYVHNGELPIDEQLFSLQSRFLTRMVRGGEREQVLPINVSPDPLPFVRPSTNSTALTGRPVGARKHRQTISPHSSEWAHYRVDRDALAGTSGPYRARIRIMAGMVPPNLVHEVSFVGFDYGMTPRGVADAVVEGQIVVDERELQLVDGRAAQQAATSQQAGASQHEGASQQAATSQQAGASQHEGASRISDEYIPLLVEGAQERPKPILELGTPFLGSGNIRRGVTVPGGAVWQPSFLLFGSYRTALSVADAAERTTTQWANRLDLFGNLYLSGTERVVFGLRPMDETVDGVRRFSGYTSLSPDPSDAGGWSNGLNFDWDTVTHLFFEGDLQELLPALDIQDRHALDLGLAIGRQPITFQEGLLIDDFVDAIGVARNNLKPRGAANLRITGLWAWNGINRNAPSAASTSVNPEADHSWLAGVFTETDFRATTMAIDALYVRGGTFPLPASAVPGGSGTAAEVAVEASDGVYLGVSFVQRIKGINTAFRAVGSAPVGEQTPTGNAAGIGNPASGGAVLFSETSWTPHHGNNLFYVNGFWAIDEYRAAALDPLIPGPLARAGILFSGVGVGNYGAALSPTADEAAGATFGHQVFFRRGRRQLLLEAAARYSTHACADDEEGCAPQSAAGGARYQIAAGRRSVFVFDGYVAYDAFRGLRTRDSRVRSGGRVELMVKF